MTDRDSSKDISLKVLDLPVIPKEDLIITSGALKPDRKLTFRYYGEIPLTNGSQFVIDDGYRRYRAVAGPRIHQYGRYASVMSLVKLPS